MTRREVISKAITVQLSWVQASPILGISARHMRRLRRKVEGWGMSAVMDQRGGRPRRRRIKAGTIELDGGSSATSARSSTQTQQELT
jgi:hypothetical protein